MKVDLNVLEGNDSFMVHPHMIANETVLLVQPTHLSVDWDKSNVIFRSSVWDISGNPVSLGFRKFVNLGEKPDLFPVPTSLHGAHLIEKTDGTCLLFSRWKGHTIIRTRGTTDARTQENGYEIDVLLAKYPDFVKMLETADTLPFTYIFEWTGSNKIVINYGDEPDMILTGIVRHLDYSYETQATLDTFAEVMSLRRPRTYSYNSIEEMKQAVADFKGVEGICLYYNNDQDILKIKAAQYLYLHRAKSEISSVEKVMDVYLDMFFTQNNGQNPPTYQEFFSYLETTFDYEIACMARPNISNICDAMKEVQKILGGMFTFVGPLFKVSRKDAAQAILQAYGSTGRSAMLFKLLDRKPLVSEDYKKLLFQCLKS
jgi:hypothetical protein